MSDKKTSVQIKKIKPFPIPAQWQRAGESQFYKGDIVKLEKNGFFIVTPHVVFKLGETVTVSMVLPVLKYQVTSQAVVIRTIHRFRDASMKEKEYLNELHFKSVNIAHEAFISEFLKLITKKG